MELTPIDELERTWRRAYLDFRKQDTLINHVREKEAWQALTDAKVRQTMCLAPGCRNIDPPHHYCKAHRED